MNTFFRFSVLFLLLPLGGCRLIAAIIMIPVKIVVGVVAVVGWILIGADRENPLDELYAGGIRVKQHIVEFEIASDLTFQGTLEIVQTVTDTAGLADAQQASLSFNPATHELELISAEVKNPDGTVHTVGTDQVFTRPSAAARNTPGFVSSLTTSVVFPQLQVGSQTSVKWRFEESARSVVGFNYMWRTPFALPVDEARIRISYEDDVPLRFGTRGPFEVLEFVKGDEHVVVATLRGYEGQQPERAMVAPRDVCPVFVATTLSSWEEIGAHYHDAVIDRIEDTPEIRAQAAEITRGLEGLDAARAIHRWVCLNIEYIAVYLDQMDVWVPHPAGSVLENGYGDCKDQFVLMASLLQAVGIRAEPVLVNLTRSFETLPLCTPLQFDHCMAYLPEFDLYSNPTDPFRDLGELDIPLSGKFVVIGSPEGRTAYTPGGDPNKNYYRMHHEVMIEDNGCISGKTAMDLAGRPSGFLRRKLARSASDDHMLDQVLIGSPESVEGDLQTTDPTDLDVPLHCDGEWVCDLKIDMAPTIYFPLPVGIDLANPGLVHTFLSPGERRYPVVITAIEVEWSYGIRLPDGYRFKSVPVGRLVNNDAASYESRYTETSPGRLEIKRVLRINEDRFPPEQYADLRAVLKAETADARTILVAEQESVALGGPER